MITDRTFRLEAVLKQSGSRKRKKIANFSNACPVMDHEGRHFRSIREMCRWWGILSDTYRYRRNRGFDKKTALTMPLQQRGRKKHDTNAAC